MYLSVGHSAPLGEKQQMMVIPSAARLSLVMVKVWYWRQNYPYNNITEVGLGASFQWTSEQAFLQFLCNLRKFLALERRSFFLSTLSPFIGLVKTVSLQMISCKLVLSSLVQNFNIGTPMFCGVGLFFRGAVAILLTILQNRNAACVGC